MPEPRRVAADAFKYRIHAAADGKPTEILIYGDIGDSWWGESVTAKQFVTELQSIEGNLDVRINSYGGAVSDGLAIYNALKRHDGAVDVWIDGVAVSIASLIAMAGDTVHIPANAAFMVHAPWGVAIGNAQELRAYAEILDRYAGAMASSYAAKTGRPVEEVAALLKDGADHWYFGQEAVDEGFADELVDEVAIAASLPRERFSHIPAAAAALFRQEPVMPLPNKPAAQNDPSPTDPPKPSVAQIEEAALKKAQAELKARNDKLTQRWSKLCDGNPGLQTELSAIIANPEITDEVATDRLMAKLGEGAGPLTPEGHRIEYGMDERDKLRAGISKVILVRMKLDKDDRTNPFRGYSLSRLAARTLEAIGIRTDGMTASDIAGKVLAAHTSSDFPLLLADAANKKLQAAYEAFPATWRMIAAVGQVTDFKTVNLIRLGSFNSLATIPEGEEYTQGTLGEEREQLTPLTKGKYIQLTRQMIVNDDLSGFSRMTTMLGRAAARTVNSDVYGVINTNAVMSDSIALFHASHSNLAGTGGAISVATLGAGRAAMRKQTPPGSNTEYLNIMPRVLAVPVVLEDHARSVVSSTEDTDTAGSRKRNPIRDWGPLEVVSDPYLDATSTAAWYLIADPMDVPLIEVHFLDGNETPFIDTNEEFLTDAVQWKVRLDYGVKSNDWRGGYKNAGP